MFYPGMYPGRPTGLPGQAPMMYPGPRVPRWAMNNGSMYGGGGGMSRQNPYYQTGSAQGTPQQSAPTSDNASNSNGPGNVSTGGMMAGMMMTPNGPMMAQPQMMRPPRPSGGPYGRSGRGGMSSYSNNGPMGMGGYGGPRSFNGQHVGGYGGMTSSSGFPPSAAYMPRRGGYNSGGGGGMSGGRGGPMMSRGGGGGYRGGPGDFYTMYGGGPSSGMMPSMMSGGLTATSLASAPPEAQKQMLGERLYPLVYAQEPSFASKITGMLLDMDNGELLHLLESPESLTGKVSEALSLLQPQQQQQITSLESLQAKVTPA